MKLAALKALLASATPGPWRVVEHKGATEFGHPIECDWLGVDGADGENIELANTQGKNTAAAIAIVNAAPALFACAEALEHHQRVFFGRNPDMTHMDREQFIAAHYAAYEHGYAALKALEDA